MTLWLFAPAVAYKVNIFRIYKALTAFNRVKQHVSDRNLKLIHNTEIRLITKTIGIMMPTSSEVNSSLEDQLIMNIWLSIAY